MTWRCVCAPRVSSVFDNDVPTIIIENTDREEVIKQRRYYQAMNYFCSEIEQVNALQEVEDDTRVDR